ncbi:hypothetical protein RS030_192795 [Cryptosporidium xiaoi]|uniref:Rad21/Rec8-like protein N-terminal domain-containing protein n=1 Tax=Cryptosporidium xiaoi TaxID=659607 RepID=A0AAV9Y0Y0_9CRYT
MELNKESSVLKYIKSESLLNLWLTAYYEKRIKKKQLVNIDIKSTVKEIIKLNNTENEWIPLRISSGLLFGVVKVYHHKVDHLDNKCNLTLNRMQNFRNFSRPENEIRKESEYLEIDKYKHSSFDKGMIDIDEINKDLDKICDDKIDHFEIVPLSQKNNSSQQLLDLSSKLPNNENDSDYPPIILDMEFDDFIDNRNEDVSMEVDDFSGNQIEVNSIQEIENLRGEAIDFEEIVARGIEDINQNRENTSENDDKSENLNEINDVYNRSSIDMYNSPKIFGNRESIGGLSSTLEMFNIGNRLSVSTESDELFHNSNFKPLQIYSVENNTKVNVSKVNEALATVSRLNRKRKKISEININSDTEIQLKLSYPSKKITNYLKRIDNIMLSYKNSNVDILKMNKILPVKMSDFLFSIANKELALEKSVEKRNLNTKNLNSKDNINTSIGSQNFDVAIEDNFNNSYEEFDNTVDNDSVRTPIRYSRKNIEHENENIELIFTPWTKYVGSQERKYIEDFPIDNTNYKKRMESLFSSREMKTMEFLNSKFSKNKILSFSELVKGSEVSVVAPIFVQILHLKSKSLINIKQEESFGEIYIYQQ